MAITFSWSMSSLFLDIPSSNISAAIFLCFDYNQTSTHINLTLVFKVDGLVRPGVSSTVDFYN